MSTRRTENPLPVIYDYAQSAPPEYEIRAMLKANRKRLLPLCKRLGVVSNHGIEFFYSMLQISLKDELPKDFFEPTEVDGYLDIYYGHCVKVFGEYNAKMLFHALNNIGAWTDAQDVELWLEYFSDDECDESDYLAMKVIRDEIIGQWDDIASLEEFHEVGIPAFDYIISLALEGYSSSLMENGVMLFVTDDKDYIMNSLANMDETFGNCVNNKEYLYADLKYRVKTLKLIRCLRTLNTLIYESPQVVDMLNTKTEMEPSFP